MAAAVVKKLERPQAAKPGFLATLQQNAKAKAPAKDKKTSVPMLDTPPEVQEVVDQYIDAKEREKIAKSEKEQCETVIIDFVRPFQDQDGYKGAFRNSYGVAGTKPGMKVTFVSSNRWTVSAEDHERLAGIVEEHFEDLFEQTFEVKLKAEVFENPDLQAALMDLVGDKFGEFFDTVQGLKVRPEFDQKIYAMVQKESLEDLRAFCKQYKPSLR